MTTPLPPSLKARKQRLDSYYSGLIVLIVAAAIGFVLIALGKRYLARTPYLVYQTPYFISGCIGGLALITTAVGMIVVLHSRRIEAELRQETDKVIDEAAALVAAVTARNAR